MDRACETLLSKGEKWIGGMRDESGKNVRELIFCSIVRNAKLVICKFQN